MVQELTDLYIKSPAHIRVCGAFMLSASNTTDISPDSEEEKIRIAFKCYTDLPPRIRGCDCVTKSISALWTARQKNTVCYRSNIRRNGECRGGSGWIRTTEAKMQQIYSLPPLATRERFLIISFRCRKRACPRQNILYQMR